MTPDRARLGPRLGPLFAVQLRFAERMSELTGRPLGETALRYTPLHRRMGLGVPPAEGMTDGWRRFAQALDAAPGLDACVAVAVEAWIAADEEPPLRPGEIGFGCFAHEAPEPDGMVQIHFYNRDTDGAGGPLARAKLARRRADLADLTRNILRRYPEAVGIRGKSWLYNLDAYRRQFPADYVASPQPAPPPLTLTGTSTWGQIADSQDNVRADIRDTVLAALPTLDPEAPWRAFPMLPLKVQAPIASFQREYGVEADATES